MKNTDLMVGNLVSLSGSLTLKVYEIHEDCFYAKDAKGSSFKNTWADLNPIPLTEEILLKCGFEKNGNFTFKNDNFKVELRGDVFCFFTYHYIVKCEHLHQLQNLYHSLTGQELKIEL